MSSKWPLTIRFKRGQPIHRQLVSRKGPPSSLIGAVTTGRNISNPKPPLNVTTENKIQFCTCFSCPQWVTKVFCLVYILFYLAFIISFQGSSSRAMLSTLEGCPIKRPKDFRFRILPTLVTRLATCFESVYMTGTVSKQSFLLW